MKGRRRRPSYANVMSTIAVFLALGGSSVAALRVSSAQLKDNSVRSRDIRNNDLRSKDLRDGEIRGRDLRDNSVGGADVTDGSLTGTDIAPESLDGASIANLGAGDFAPGQLPDPVPTTLPGGKTLTGVFAAAVTG